MNFNYQPRFCCKMHERIKVNYVTESDEIGLSRQCGIRKFCFNVKRIGNPRWCIRLDVSLVTISLAHAGWKKEKRMRLMKLNAQWHNRETSWTTNVNRDASFLRCVLKPAQRYLLHLECPKDNSFLLAESDLSDLARRIIIKRIILYFAYVNKLNCNWI